MGRREVVGVEKMRLREDGVNREGLRGSPLVWNVCATVRNRLMTLEGNAVEALRKKEK